MFENPTELIEWIPDDNNPFEWIKYVWPGF